MKLNVVLLVLAAGFYACGQEETLLDAHRLLGSTPAQLTARLGETGQSREETERVPGFMTWRNIDGVRVHVVIQRGQAIYVAYTFVDPPFDEDEALRLIGVVRPKAEPQRIGVEARRWRPFGKYEKLTINPATRVVSLGNEIEWESEQPEAAPESGGATEP